MKTGDRSLVICVVTQQLAQIISGIGLHTHNLIHHLVAAGHQVYVVAPWDQRPTGSLPFRFLGVPRSLFSRSQARWFTLSWHFRCVLTRIQREVGLDLIHFTDAREALFMRRGTPAIGNINDVYAADVQSLAYYRTHYTDWLARWTYYRMVHLCERIALRRLDAVVANSYYTAGVIQARYSIPPERLYVCHKSIEPSSYAAAHSLRQSVVRHRPCLLFVGGNMQRKGLPTLIRAASQVLAALPDALFLVVGRDAAQPQMLALCHQEGVAAHFQFLGLKSQAELVHYYARADVFVMPSLIEAFGVVFLEAMAAGVPVVATRVGGIVEIIDDEQNGLLVEPDAPDQLAQALIRLLRDPVLQERLRQAGLATVRRFTVEQMMHCTYRVYQDVVFTATGRRRGAGSGQ